LSVKEKWALLFDSSCDVCYRFGFLWLVGYL